MHYRIHINSDFVINKPTAWLVIFFFFFHPDSIQSKHILQRRRSHRNRLKAELTVISWNGNVGGTGCVSRTNPSLSILSSFSSSILKPRLFYEHLYFLNFSFSRPYRLRICLLRSCYVKFRYTFFLREIFYSHYLKSDKLIPDCVLLFFLLLICTNLDWFLINCLSVWRISSYW